jgi:hypothetical protein
MMSVIEKTTTVLVLATVNAKSRVANGSIIFTANWETNREFWDLATIRRGEKNEIQEIGRTTAPGAGPAKWR